MRYTTLLGGSYEYDDASVSCHGGRASTLGRSSDRNAFQDVSIFTQYVAVLITREDEVNWM